MGYSTQRGYAHSHPVAGEIRYGVVEVELVPEDLGFPVVVGEIALTECQMATARRAKPGTRAARA